MKSKSKTMSKSYQAAFEKIIMHGGYFFPAELGKFFIELAQPKPNEKILRIGFNEPSLGFPNESEFFPQDISSEMLIAERQKLLDQEKFDVILCAPSFGVPSGENNQPSEEMWIEWGIKHLENGGRFVIIVPIGLLSNYSQILIRQFVIEHSKLEAIIELSSGWTPSTAISASILYITAGINKNQSVKMFQLSQNHNLSFTDLAKEVRSADPKLLDPADGKVFTVTSSEIDQSRLDIKYYDPVYKISSPGPDFEAIKLSALVNIRSGSRFTTGDFDSIGVPFVQVRNITTAGEFDLRDVKKIKADVAINNRSFCEAEDVLISTAGTIGKVAVVPAGINVCIDTSLRQLRIKDKSKVLPEYLALFLRSDTARLQTQRMSSGSVIHVLSTPNLENLVVYLPSISKQHEIVALYNKTVQEVQSQMLTLFPALEKVLEIFPKGTNAKRKKTVEPIVLDEMELGFPEPNTARTRVHSKKEKSLNFIVPNKFPYPLARAYTLLVNSSSESGSKQVQSLFFASESIVYYSFGILVSDYIKKYSTDNPEFNPSLLDSLYDFSIDKKLKFIQSVIKKSQEEKWNFFVPEIANAAFSVCSEIHNTVRNDYAHNETSEPWCKKQVKDYSPKLERLLQSLLPLINYKLVQVKRIDVRGERLQHSMITMMGNNAIFTPQIAELDSVLPVETGHVFLLDEDNNTLDLHPFYQFHAWKNTNHAEHLCVAKQIKQQKNMIRLESLLGSGTTDVDVDIEFSNILNQMSRKQKHDSDIFLPEA